MRWQIDFLCWDPSGEGSRCVSGVCGVAGVRPSAARACTHSLIKLSRAGPTPPLQLRTLRLPGLEATCTGDLQALGHVGVQLIPGNVAEQTSLPGLAGLTVLAVSSSYSCCGCFAVFGREFRSRESFSLGPSPASHYHVWPELLVWSAVSGRDVSSGDSEYCSDLGRVRS